VKLIVGLGNWGPRYAKTRHNVGFLVVDRWAARHEQRITTPWGQARRPLGMVCDFAWLSGGQEEQVILLKPATMVNESGRAVHGALTTWPVETAECLVVSDDLNLPLGTLRLRGQGSAGGHHGLESIIRTVGSSAFPRLRLGIGVLPPRTDATAYVLTPFARTEWPTISTAIERATDVLETWVREGLTVAMNQCNRRSISTGA